MSNRARCRLNLLYLITGLDVGGTEKVLARLVAGLNKERYRILVCSLQKRGPVADEIERCGIKVVSLDMEGKLNLNAPLKLFSLLKKEKVDILHSYLFHANLLARIVGRLARVPIIISSERTMEMEGRHRLIINRLTAPLADCITVNSNSVREFVSHRIGIDSQKLVTIYNGLDVSDFQRKEGDSSGVKKKWGIDSDKVVIGCVARFDPPKGVEYLLQAAVRVIAKHPNALFLLVGYGPLRRKLEDMTEELGLASKVIFTGECNDVPGMLSIMDIFVLPSLYEGFPNAVLEAMAASRPVVATSVAGIPEIVVDNETGLLVPRANPEALAEAINTLIQYPEMAEKMGQAGRSRVEDYFSLEKMVEETEELYERLIEKGKRE
ncbi:MAG: glycosyltransferase [bacterium]|nr:glycosyltransferase [bacterium]